MTRLTDEERAIYEWQMWIDGFGETGQERLKGASALVSRCGGLGGPLSYHLASAGIGRLVIAHGGNLKPSDLNRQILMTQDGIGKPRVESARRRLLELNPRMDIEAVGENVSESNARALVSKVDIVFDCAPLFSERFLMNRECVRQGKPMVEAAVFGLEGQVMTMVPGETPCLSCVYPEDPPAWKRRFPVVGAVPGIAAAIAAAEGIQHIVGLGASLRGAILYFDTRSMEFRRIPVPRRPECPICGSLPWKEGRAP